MCGNTASQSDILCDFRKALAGVDEGIDFDWSGYKGQQGAVNPSCMATPPHGHINILDSDM